MKDFHILFTQLLQMLYYITIVPFFKQEMNLVSNLQTLFGFCQLSHQQTFSVQDPVQAHQLHFVFMVPWSALIRDNSLVFLFHNFDSLKSTGQLFCRMFFDLCLIFPDDLIQVIHFVKNIIEATLYPSRCVLSGGMWSMCLIIGNEALRSLS